MKELSEEDKKEISDKRKELIKSFLESIFGKNNCLLKSSGAPVSENMNEFFECTKK